MKKYKQIDKQLSYDHREVLFTNTSLFVDAQLWNDLEWLIKGHVAFEKKFNGISHNTRRMAIVFEIPEELDETLVSLMKDPSFWQDFEFENQQQIIKSKDLS